MKAIKRIGAGLALSVLVATSAVAPRALAADDTGQNISQSYTSSTSLKAGTIVSTVSGSSTKIEAANVANATHTVGVVVSADNSLVAVDPGSDKVQVAASGKVSTLVSTVNGDIKTGDPIAASPYSGVGMKAVDQGYIVGKATANFSASTKGATTQQVTTTSGKKVSITVGYILVTITPGYNGGAENVNGLQRTVRSITGHVVSMPRIIIGMAIAIVTILGVVILVYGAIYGAIMSIGRNPLAQQSILKALGGSIVMALLAVGVAFVLLFFLLS